MSEFQETVSVLKDISSNVGHHEVKVQTHYCICSADENAAFLSFPF